MSQSWVRPFKLNLQKNSLRRLYPNGFQHLGSAVALNLGGNALQDIRVGSFQGLAKLRRLYLHENKLEVFRNDTFAGLEALEYLQVGGCGRTGGGGVTPGRRDVMFKGVHFYSTRCGCDKPKICLF